MHSGHVVTKPLVGARFIAPRMVAGAPWHMTWRGGCAVACNGRRMNGTRRGRNELRPYMRVACIKTNTSVTQGETS